MTVARAQQTYAALAALPRTVRPSSLIGGPGRTMTINDNGTYTLFENGVPQRVVILHSSCDATRYVDTPIRTGLSFPGSGAGGSIDASYAFWRPKIEAALDPLRSRLASKWCIACSVGALRSHYEQPGTTFNWNPAGITAGSQRNNLVLAFGSRGSATVNGSSVPRYELAVYRSYLSADEGAAAYAAMWRTNVSALIDRVTAAPSDREAALILQRRWTGHEPSSTEAAEAARRCGG